MVRISMLEELIIKLFEQIGVYVLICTCEKLLEALQ